MKVGKIRILKNELFSIVFLTCASLTLIAASILAFYYPESTQKISEFSAININIIKYAPGIMGIWMFILLFSTRKISQFYYEYEYIPYGLFNKYLYNNCVVIVYNNNAWRFTYLKNEIFKKEYILFLHSYNYKKELLKTIPIVYKK